MCAVLVLSDIMCSLMCSWWLRLSWGCLCIFYLFWPSHVGFLNLGSSGSPTIQFNSCLPGCFCPLTFSFDIELTMLQLRTPRVIFFSCDQAALWMVFSVCPSICLSFTLFWLCSHRIIMKFSGVITKEQGNVHAKGQGQWSKVKVTEVTTQLNRFRTVTPVWIHIWWWNDTYSLMLLRRGALWFFKVIRQISRSHGAKNRRIWPRLGVSRL